MQGARWLKQIRSINVTRLAVATVSLAIVMGVTFWESEQLASPGPLHPSHADLPELRGRKGCAACHADADRPMGESCTGCHEVILDQLNSATGLHGQIEPAEAARCDTCHREHAGDMLPIVTEFSFFAAGVTDPTHYDHRHIEGYDLAGRHAQLKCHACHEMADAVALAPGERRFLGLSVRCASCHEDPHEAALGADCASCHGQSEPFDLVAEFVHDDAFPLLGGHAALACSRCHDDRAQDSLEDLRAAPDVVRLCVACHQTPHRKTFLHGVADLSDRRRNATCSLCHDATHETFVGPAVEMAAELHAASGFPLTAPHEDLDCTKCHADFGQREALPQTDQLAFFFANVFPGRTADDCKTCHGDAHEGQFDTGVTDGRCIECHERTHFLPSAFDLENHARSTFPLTGAHLAVACLSCHAEEGPPRRFVPTPTACAECHEDPHEGRFDGPGKPSSVEGRIGCARCHETSGFATVHLSSQTHQSLSGYPLKGPHASLACRQCHEPEGGEALLLAPGFRRPPRGCASCHIDPHAGQFLVDGFTDCTRCHSESPSTELTVFDHQVDSRFELDEHHRTLACDACHKPVSTSSGIDVIRYRPLGMRCEDCHDSRRRPGGLESG